jgi:hypothetical protein
LIAFSKSYALLNPCITEEYSSWRQLNNPLAQWTIKILRHWRDDKSGHGRRRIFKNIDDAAHLFWQKQNIELDCRTAKWTGIDHSWTFES